MEASGQLYALQRTVGGAQCQCGCFRHEKYLDELAGVDFYLFVKCEKLGLCLGV
jgi:hypothetical protein